MLKKHIVTYRVLAESYGIKRATAKKLMAEGKLTPHVFGKRTVFDSTEVERLIESVLSKPGRAPYRGQKAKA